MTARAARARRWRCTAEQRKRSARAGRERRLTRSGASDQRKMALTIKKVGVIGAGQMGSGIAHVCALAGFDVKLNDVSPDRIKAGIATINGNLARQGRKKTISEDERQGAPKRNPAADRFGALRGRDPFIQG